MDLPKRKSNRLKNYDYSSNGAYFVTICIKDRKNLFWNVGATFGRPQGNNYLSDFGMIVDKEINKINNIYSEMVKIDKYVVMPNHIHIILQIQNIDGRPKVAPTISRIIQQFKGSVTKQIGFSVWQKLFHDHIIRNKQDYLKIWEYIDTNPAKWEQDCFYNERILNYNTNK